MKNLITIKKIAVLTTIVLAFVFSMLSFPAYAFVQPDLEVLISTGNAPNADLSNADLHE